MPEVYTLPIQTAGRRLAKRVDSTKRTKWAKCWSRVTSGWNRQKPHFHVNTTLLWSGLILVSDQTGFPTWEVKYAYHMSCRVYFSSRAKWELIRSINRRTNALFGYSNPWADNNEQTIGIIWKIIDFPKPVDKTANTSFRSRYCTMQRTCSSSSCSISSKTYWKVDFMLHTISKRIT